MYISGFSDEIDKNIDIQFQVLNKLNIKFFEPRGIDGKNISLLTLDEAKEFFGVDFKTSFISRLLKK